MGETKYDSFPSVDKKKEPSFSKWKEHKALLDALKEEGMISEYLYQSMSDFLRRKLGAYIVK